MINRSLTLVTPASAFGTTTRQLSSGLSKTLIPLNGRPILDWILESIKALPYMIDNIVIVTNESGDVKEFIENTYKCTPLYNKIKCVVQDYRYKGPGGAILTGIEAVQNTGGGYLIWLGDTVCRHPFKIFDSNIYLATSKVAAVSSHRWCIPYINNHDYKFLNKLSYNQILEYYKNEEYIDALIGIYYFPVYNNALSKTNSQYTNRSHEIEISELIDLYVSYDKNISINLIDVQNDWYDCGELDSFYESKARLLNLACREQSGLQVNAELNTVKKYSYTESGTKKLQKEYEWYKSREHSYQKLFVPKIIDHDDNSYTMELSSGTPLSDMFIYEKVPMSGWKTILKRAIDIYHNYFAFNTEINTKENLLDKCKHYNALAEEFYYQRPLQRLTENNDFYASLNESFNITECKEYLKSFVSDISACYKFNTEMFLTTQNFKYYPRNMIDTYEEQHKNYKTYADIHGDFHLGNILFDAMSGKYTFLDPRGGEMYVYKNNSFHNNDKLYVDSYYDMAKLYHDLYCGYMLMIRGICTLNDGKVNFSEYHKNMMKEAVEFLDIYLKSEYNYNIDLIKRLATIQVLTCIPFHKDDPNRCKLFLTRALNIMSNN